jgi:hypothetical protein
VFARASDECCDGVEVSPVCLQGALPRWLESVVAQLGSKQSNAIRSYADTHEAASIRRCWSTWNTLCSFLFTADLLPTGIRYFPIPLSLHF